MNREIKIEEIVIRTELRPGDIGLGNQLMQLFMKFLLHCGYKLSYLWTTKELNAAAHLYLKYGFRLTEEKESDAFGKRVVEQKYELIV